MPLYYSAADALLYISSDSKIRNFAGISNANIESLACGTPVYSSQLSDFLGSENEKKSLGIQYNSESDLVEDIDKIIENKDKFVNCRTIVKKYYNRKENTKKILGIYQNLLNNKSKGQR